jgi:anti-anti-sigma factor
MSVSKQYHADEHMLLIKIIGDFDARLVDEFNAAYQGIEHEIEVVLLDLNDTSYVDSSALGILIALREHAQQQGWRVVIKNMDDVVQEIFRVLNFHHLFPPEHDPQTGDIFWCFRPK